MRTTQLLLFFPLVWCQTTESLTDKQVNLGGNVTLDCQIGVKDIYWIFQKLTDSPVLILRTFTSYTASSHTQDKRLKGKYSSLTLSRLFMSNITSDEIGIYYCAKANKTLQISEGIRLYTTESAQDQNQMEDKYQEQTCEKTFEFYKILILTSILLHVVLIIAIIVAQDQNQPEVNNHSQLPNTQQALIVLYVLLNILMFSAVIGLFQIKLQVCKNRHQQCENEELEQLNSTHDEEFSEVEFCQSQPTNNTFVSFQKPKTKP